VRDGEADVGGGHGRSLGLLGSSLAVAGEESGGTDRGGVISKSRGVFGVILPDTTMLGESWKATGVGMDGWSGP
jgi:hypothetical protein